MTEQKSRMPKITTQIFIGMIASVAVGYFFKDFAPQLKLLSDVFLHLIKMIIAPLVFTTLVMGVAKTGDFKSVGRIGIKTLLYFQFATALALTLGLLIVNILTPGKWMSLTLPAKGADTGLAVQKIHDFKTFILDLVPTSIFDAMADNAIIQIVIFALFFGVAAAAVGEKAEPVLKVVDSAGHIMLKVTNYVMALAPIGVFGAMAAVVAVNGLAVLSGYGFLILCFFGGLLFFIFVILGSICLVLKIPFFKLLKEIKEPTLMAFSTASSESAFPKTIESLERFGCSHKIVSFVLPLGYSFNLDGSIMYMTFASVFIAQAYGIDLSMQEQITMMLILLITSKGMAGIPRASLVVIAGTLATFNIPVEGLVLLMGIDQILDMGRSATNVVGNAVATVVVSKWEKELKLVS
ncbi:MAG: cation:dicarboxylase symporter family transporter [Bacteroidetes bacterium]|nr:cation:dicarboxylase symporter family transporter [Bacteroidota bacterium]